MKWHYYYVHYNYEIKSLLLSLQLWNEYYYYYFHYNYEITITFITGYLVANFITITFITIMKCRVVIQEHALGILFVLSCQARPEDWWFRTWKKHHLELGAWPGRTGTTGWAMKLCWKRVKKQLNTDKSTWCHETKDKLDVHRFVNTVSLHLYCSVVGVLGLFFWLPTATLFCVAVWLRPIDPSFCHRFVFGGLSFC